MNVLFLGDVFGKPGRELVIKLLPDLIGKHAIDFCVINGENLADGRGLTQKTTKHLFEAGVDFITGGNHLWDRAEALDYIASQANIVKPLNYPDAAPGAKWCTLRKAENCLTVMNLCGQIYMPPADSPFICFDKYYSTIETEAAPILIDFHAESTAEKRALAWHVEGKVAALIGTHTHIQTADEEVLPGGTAYITDAGMCGPHDSVIGIKKKIILEKMRSSIPGRYEVSDRGLQINGVLIAIDIQSYKAQSISRIRILEEQL